MQVRDVLFVEDLVDAFLLAQANIHTLSGQAFNIGGGLGNTISLLELLELIGALHGEKPDVAHEGLAAGRPALLRLRHAQLQGGDRLGAEGERALRSRAALPMAAGIARPGGCRS